jgi:hypothetical protein
VTAECADIATIYSVGVNFTQVTDARAAAVLPSDVLGRLGRRLKKLIAEIAKLDRVEFFFNYPKWSMYYSDRILGIALCQGAAVHYSTGKTGINDFDVFPLYRKNPLNNSYARRIKTYDFVNAKIGKTKGFQNY